MSSWQAVGRMRRWAAHEVCFFMAMLAAAICAAIVSHSPIQAGNIIFHAMVYVYLASDRYIQLVEMEWVIWQIWQLLEDRQIEITSDVRARISAYIRESQKRKSAFWLVTPAFAMFISANVGHDLYLSEMLSAQAAIAFVVMAVITGLIIGAAGGVWQKRLNRALVLLGPC